MKSIYFSSILLAFAATCITAQPNLLWESRYHGTLANDQGNKIALDASGNVYIAGYTETLSGLSDYLTIKYNANGDTLWTRKYNGTANATDEVSAIYVDASGNVYITGRSEGMGTGYNIVTIKYNTNGIQQWASIFSGPSNSVDEGHNIAVDIFGNVYVTGISNFSGAIIKYNSSGAIQWNKAIAFSQEGKVLIAINNNDNHIVVSSGDCLHCTYFLRVLEPVNGNTVKSFNTVAFNQLSGIPNAIALDGLGNIYVTSMTTVQTSSSPRTVHTAKYIYTGSATYVWWHSTFINGNGTMEGIDVKVDNNNNVYVLMKWFNTQTINFVVKKLHSDGTHAWSTPGNSGTNPIYIPATPVSLTLSKLSPGSPPDIYATGYNQLGDIRTAKYSNATGDTLWTKTYDCGNNGADIATAMVSDNCDNIYITGTSNCSGTFKDVKTIKYSAGAAPTISASGPTTFCQGGSVALNASPGNAYLWSNGATSQFISVSMSGSYSVTVTNAAGCQSVSDDIIVTVVQPPVASVTPAGQVNICQGTATTLSASPANTYLWNTGATTQSIPVSTAGNYWVTVTNAAGCSAVSAITAITVQAAPTATVMPEGSIALCQGNSTTLTASAASSYLWNTGAISQDITVSATGTYWVTVTNAAGCSAVSPATSVTVNPIPTPTITPSGLVTICQGNSVVITASPASSYLWSNGATSPGITVTTPGTYTVTVTNAAGCVGSSSATTVNFESPPVATITPSGPTTFCQGGSVILTASQANTYQWNTGAITQNLLVSATGVYSITITNATGCMATANIDINATPVATITLEANDTTCGNTDGFIITNISGGSPIASFLWSNGATTQIIYNLPGGIYSLTATDVNNCTVTAQATVVGRVNPTVDLGPDITINSGQQVTLIPNVTGNGLSYLWSTNATTPTITVTASGNYTVTVTNSDGCTATDAVVVNVITSIDNPGDKLRIKVFPNPATDVIHVTCEGGAALSARVVNVLGEQLLIDTTPIPDGAVRTLWLGDIAAGFYYFELKSEYSYKVVPIVKQ